MVRVHSHQSARLSRQSGEGEYIRSHEHATNGTLEDVLSVRVWYFGLNDHWQECDACCLLNALLGVVPGHNFS